MGGWPGYLVGLFGVLALVVAVAGGGVRGWAGAGGLAAGGGVGG